MSKLRFVASAKEVRAQFLDFFAERGHTRVPSAPVVPADDPTLLFTNAGMNQFKDVFLGTGTRPYKRAVDTQKCIRVSGKHNDLEEVGLDSYHHTFFEMLGNWSFGDYFKREAIGWSWELLTTLWALPKERLWVTVFGGDPGDGLPADEEAAEVWRACTDIDPAHVLRFGRKDNFWEMGETGPCGPCTEIHIDRGESGSNPADGADPRIGVNAGNERFIELWNNVFIQFNRRDDGALVALPARHVDTGMGFERVLSVLQGKRSNYDTDLFAPLFERIAALTGKPYGASASRADVAFRVCADHMRAVTSALCDGALPSNTGRGYVVRRLIRRAARFGRQELGLEEPFLHALVPTVSEVLGQVFPEIAARVEHVQRIVAEEERSFGRTLGRGLVLFDELAGRIASHGGRVLPGAEAYDLYATYGFPQDLVEQMLRERGWTLDHDGWRRAAGLHKDASRSEGHLKRALPSDLGERLKPTISTYHENQSKRRWTLTTYVQHAGWWGGSQEAALVLEESPFYVEGGGQVGDSGRIEALDGSFAMDVTNTIRSEGVVLHVGRVTAVRIEGLADLHLLRLQVRATVNRERRDRTRKNHTATHLLHKALRDHLGNHVTQQGSYVGPDRLRFDFSHPRAVSAEELEEVERRVNADVYSNPRVETTLEDLEVAKSRGVMALFGEKYDQQVRVVRCGASQELCGGTHVRAAGDIGPFVILSERAIQAGVRRIEALSGPAAVEWIQGQRRALCAAARALKSAPDEVPARVEALQAELKEARKKGAQGAAAESAGALERLRGALSDRGGVRCGVLDAPELDQSGVRELGERARGALRDAAFVLLGRQEDRVPYLVACSGRALERGLKAGEIARELNKHLDGRGGGRPELAQGAGQDATAVAAAKAAIEELFAGVLQG